MKISGDLQKINRYYSILEKLKNPYSYWTSPNNIILEHETLRLRRFPNPIAADAKRPVLILPPQAGHHANIADYSEDQSLVKVFHRYGFDVYVTEWLSATTEHRELGIEDYIRLTDEAVEEIRRRTGIYRVHIVGECQGGWQAAVYTSLFPDKIASLVAAAAPFDVQAAPSQMVDYARYPMAFFRYLAAIGNGVLRGRYILRGFKNMQPEEHYVQKYHRLWNMINEQDEEGLRRFIRFENWYEFTQDLPGRFYLEIVEWIFKRNLLMAPDAIRLNGRGVDLREINCPVILMAGEKDHITPAPQLFALRNIISTRPDNIIEIHTKGGHIGTLMGNEALRDNWTTVNEMLLQVI